MKYLLYLILVINCALLSSCGKKANTMEEDEIAEDVVEIVVVELSPEEAQSKLDDFSSKFNYDQCLEAYAFIESDGTPYVLRLNYDRTATLNSTNYTKYASYTLRSFRNGALGNVSYMDVSFPRDEAPIIYRLNSNSCSNLIIRGESVYGSIDDAMAKNPHRSLPVKRLK